MKNSRFSGLLFGATALALVSTSAAFAQQNTGPAAGQQQTDEQGQQQAGDEPAAQQGQQAQGRGGQQGAGMQQAMDDLREQLQQVRQALGQQDVAGAEHALTEAEQALDEVRTAAQQGSGKQGDITVTVVPADQQQAQATADAERQPLSVEETNRLLGIGDRELGDAAEMLTLTAVELRDRDVVTMDDEEVGEVAEVVASGGQFYAVIEHGGFLGIGQDRVAIPLERIGMRGEEVVLLGLTEEQLEAMPDHDYEADEAVADEQAIEIGRYQ